MSRCKIAKATAKGFGEIAKRYAGHDAIAAIELYISREHRDVRGQGGPAAALSCEAARQPNETKSVFAAGIENLLRALEDDMARNHAPGAGTRAQAISVLAQAVGAIVLSRVCPDNSPLADEILDACRADCRDAIANPVRSLRVLVCDRDDDLTLRAPGLDIGQRIPSLLKWEHRVDDRSDHAGFDQGRNLAQLPPLRAHEQE